jgi:hypothetical protein
MWLLFSSHFRLFIGILLFKIFGKSLSNLSLFCVLPLFMMEDEMFLLLCGTKIFPQECITTYDSQWKNKIL